MISLLTVSVSACFDTSQHKTNQLTLKDRIGMVIMTKYGVHSDGTVLSTGLENIEFELYKVSDGEDIKLGVTLTTDASDLIKVDGLTDGNYYFKELDPAPGYEFELDESGNPFRKHPFTIDVTKDHGLVQMQVKNVRSEGSFSIEKKVIMSENSNPEDYQDIEFEFKVYINEKIDDPSAVDNTIYPYTLQDGSVHEI